MSKRCGGRDKERVRTSCYFFFPLFSEYKLTQQLTETSFRVKLRGENRME